ncbi:MAG TPA: thioredoxin family protein [Cyclobacteriaceae bacterium]|nr:thioredoxin family protein [Cyclobacteriaceae bacterium]
MKITMVVFAILLTTYYSGYGQSTDATLHWLNDVNEVQALSKSTGKPIFAFFTGSDWCAWCKKLQADVFAKPEFKSWASEEVVLLELDFPARKTLPENLVKQNQAMKNFFKISGFPTVWLFCLNKDQTKENNFIISPFGSLGYPKDPVLGQEEDKFLELAKAIVADRTCQ